MPSIPTGIPGLSKLSYITTSAPNTHVYTYTKTYNSSTYTWSGSLNAINFTIAPYSTYNVSGVVLRESGKKLYPEANPGVDRYMVSVYINNPNVDVGIMETMYIDPNCSVFALFNGDKSTYIATSADDHASPASQDLGNPVYTLGNITTTQGNIGASAGSISAYGNITTTNGNIAATTGTITAYGTITTSNGNIAATTGTITAYGTITTSSGNIVATTGGITAALPIRSTTVSAITPNGNVVVNPALGQVFTLTIASGQVTNVTAVTPNNVPGQVIYIIVSGQGVGSRIDFNAGFRSQNAGQLTMDATTVSFTFVSDGTNFYEVARTGSLLL